MFQYTYVRFILGFAILTISSFAQSNSQFTYNIIDDGIEVSGCVNTCPTNMKIPEIIDNLPVISIASNSFQNSGIVNVFIPKSISEIGRRSFLGNPLSKIHFLGDYPSPRIFNATNIEANEFYTGFTIIDYSFSQISYPSEPSYCHGHVINSIGPFFGKNSCTAFGSTIYSGGLSDTEFFYCNGTNGWEGVAFYTNESVTRTDCRPWPSSDYDDGGGLQICDKDINLKLAEPVELLDCENDHNSNTTTTSILDFDKNSSIDALTDGLLLLRYAFGLRGENLTNAAISSESTLTPQEVEANIVQAASIADIDKNGSIDALTDGLLLLRYTFGLRGDNLIDGAIASDALRSLAFDIEAYIESFLP